MAEEGYSDIHPEFKPIQEQIDNACAWWPWQLVCQQAFEIGYKAGIKDSYRDNLRNWQNRGGDTVA